jgi:hypothetical protein
MILQFPIWLKVVGGGTDHGGPPPFVSPRTAYMVFFLPEIFCQILEICIFA